MTTIVDVARAAGVSTTLVSRYLNHRPGVGAASRQKIQAAISALGYQPNALARSLVLQHTGTLGVVVDDLSAPALQPLLRALEELLPTLSGGAAYSLLYTSSFGKEARKQQQLDYFVHGHADGVLYVGSMPRDDAAVLKSAAQGIPVVLLENDLPGLPRVLLDNCAGARDTTQRLLALGHRDILFVGGNPKLRISEERAQGYHQAMAAAALPARTETPDYSAAEHYLGPLGSRQAYYDAGVAHMRALLARGSLPQAIFYATDLVAFGGIATLQQAGVRIPQDLSVAGFDDETVTAFQLGLAPITSRRAPTQAAAQAALQLLLGRVRGEPTPETVVLSGEFVPRYSTAERN